MHEFGNPYCNCEGCMYARDGKEICNTCGCIVGEGCPEHDEDTEEV